MRAGFVAALLLALYYVMAVSATFTKGATFDEIVHVTAGYNAWVNHDLRFDPGNGDFVKRWAALPLLVTRPTFPARDTAAWQAGDFFAVSREFLFQSGNDPDAILLPARAMVALIGVALGALIFAIARRLFGDRGGLVATALFAFCPHLLAHGALVTTDLALAFALLASTWRLWRLLEAITWRNAILSLLAFALLVTSKMSAVLILPIATVMLVVRWRRGPRWSGSEWRSLVALGLAHALFGWAAIWAVFEFRYEARANPADVQLVLQRTAGARVDGTIGRVARFCHEHRLLPEGYLKGMEELVGISQRRPAFMNGAWHTGGRAMFFPYAFWVKTSPALLALLVLALVTWRRDWRYATTPLWALLAIYGTVALLQELNIGHRHLLPIYPVLFICAGATASLFSSRWSAILAGLLVGGYALESLATRPDYLAYFSPVAGGPAQGYRRLVDSSLDWGQDLPALKRWLEANNADDRRTVFLSYFGTDDPERHGVTSWRLPGFPEWRPLRVFALKPGLYAISATNFHQVYTTTFGPWTRAYETEYQDAIQRLGLTPAATQETMSLAAALRSRPEAEWQELYSRYEKLRFARLCAWLRENAPTPDAEVGHSILIWDLDARAVHDALWGDVHAGEPER